MCVGSEKNRGKTCGFGLNNLLLQCTIKVVHINGELSGAPFVWPERGIRQLEQVNKEGYD